MSVVYVILAFLFGAITIIIAEAVYLYTFADTGRIVTCYFTRTLQNTVTS